ncbi:nucleophile aminohydrolase [Chaetomium sp. MPI-SDFR-AT-0129]|nr:nucleophile aminohydrolase [Chaetomium sp. MPI-SDFR-AT-0129]
MEYKRLQPASPAKIQPRLIIHGGAGNITPANLTPDRYAEFRAALLTIISKSHHYMTTPTSPSQTLPTALATATNALTLLEDNPLFNAGHGAVFTRDGLNELEASVMVSRGHAKRAAGVSGLRRVRNPILLAREVLERGEGDLWPRVASDGDLDVPSAQGHRHIHGAAAEALAEAYGLALVEPEYFWTARRWNEHVRGLEREKDAKGNGLGGWSEDEYVPLGTVGAVAVDEDAVVCVATSTGGLTNKLTGRIGDTPTIGAGFWAEEWVDGNETVREQGGLMRLGPAVVLSGAIKGWFADCFPTPCAYSPLVGSRRDLVTTRSVAVSGTGNGDSFLRTGAARTVGALARFAGHSSASAVTRVIGPDGEVQRSAEDRWGKTGEGEGGMIGIETVVVRDADGNVMETKSELLQEFNCGGMFRAWVDDRGIAYARVFREEEERRLPRSYMGDMKLDGLISPSYRD